MCYEPGDEKNLDRKGLKMDRTSEIQALIKTLKEGDREMQAKAAAQLTQMGPAAAQPLRELTTHPELRVRMLAIMALSEIEK